MMNHANADIGCLLVGEYADEGEPPSNAAFGHSEVVRPQLVADSLDLWGRDDGFKEFTVLLKDGRVVAVRGHSLKHLPATVTGESGSYGITIRTGSEEVLVALFKIVDVVGIFHGEVRSDRKIA
jgi:hypothetical protein